VGATSARPRPHDTPGTGEDRCLEVRGLERHFGPVRANDGVDASFRFGEIHGLLGENGAGKSTLIKILGGIYRPDAGEIRLDGEPVRFASADEARRRGIAIVHQHSALVGRLTVLENVALQFGGRGRVDRSLPAAIRATAEGLGFALDPQARVDELSPGDRQRAEITRALMASARVVVLDEPTAVLADAERAGLFALLRRLARAGTAVVLVTHRLEEAIAHCDRVTVLRHGRTVATFDAPGTATARDLVQAMVGELRVVERRPAPPPGAEVLSVRGVRGTPPGGRPLEITDLAVAAGQVLGVAGVEGNGQGELSALLTGSWQPPTGVVLLHGRPLAYMRPEERLRRIGDVPADEAEAVCAELSVWENLAVTRLAWRERATRRTTARLRREAADLVERFHVRTPSVDAPAGQLSGGNRRRVQLARELSKEPDVLVATYATKGLDVRSIEQVKRWCRDRAAGGGAVVYIASDLDELLDVSDRVAVLARGRIAGGLDRDTCDAARLGALMLGGTAVAA
jgi:general nucleoside transport system ATP-binding protein